MSQSTNDAYPTAFRLALILRLASYMDEVMLVAEAQKKNPQQAVVVAGDKSVRYEQVMKVMSALQKEKVARVGLAVLVVASFWTLDLRWAAFYSPEAVASMGRFVGEFFPPDLTPAFVDKVNQLGASQGVGGRGVDADGPFSHRGDHRCGSSACRRPAAWS